MIRGDSGNRGFTLIEMIVVLALISTMLFIGLPPFRDIFFDAGLKSTSRKVIGFVNGVRELAARERLSYFLYIDMTAQSLWFTEDQEDSGKGIKNEPQEKLVLPDGVRIFEVQTEGSGQFSEGEKKIWINQKGYMEQMVLHLKDRNEKIFSLYFQPFLENVTVHEKYTPLP
ncbi:pilus assembly FimT family protein [Desulfomarina sp.]